MKSMVLKALNTLVLENTAIPAIKDDQALVRVRYCGICGSDPHAYSHALPFVHLPVIQGHEFSGEVSQVGRNSRNIKVGDRVVVNPSVLCGKCVNCRNGREHICLDSKVLGFQIDGAFREYIPVDADKIYRLPAGVDLEGAALMEPLAVGVHAARKAGLKSGDKVLIIGAGTIGLSVFQVCLAYGAHVVITAKYPHQAELAEKIAGSHSARVVSCDRELKSVVREEFGEDGVDAIMVCIDQEVFTPALELARKGTRIVLIGHIAREVSFNINKLQGGEIEVVGSVIYKREDFGEAVALMAAGKTDGKSMITHRFPLEKLEDGYRVMMDKTQGNIKVMMEIS